MLYTSTFLRMALSYFFTVSSFATFFLFPLFILDHGGSKADTGILMGAFWLSTVLCRPWISSMIDRIGRKKSFTLGTIILAALPLAYLFFHGELRSFYLPLLLVRVIHGIGLAILITSGLTYMGDIVPENRLIEGIGMFGITGLSAMAVGPAVAEMIIGRYGFDLCFISASLLALIGLGVHFHLPESYAGLSRTGTRSFFGVVRQRKTLWVVFLALLFGIGLAASGTFVSPYAKENELLFISPYYIAYSSAAILTRIFGSRLADRVGEERLIPPSLFLGGAGFLLLILVGGIPILVLSGFIIGCGHGFLFPCLNALAIRNEPAEIRGKVTGVFTGSVDAGSLAGSIVLGFIAEYAGFRVLFLVSALAFFVGCSAWKWKKMGLEREPPVY